MEFALLENQNEFQGLQVEDDLQPNEIDSLQGVVILDEVRCGDQIRFMPWAGRSVCAKDTLKNFVPEVVGKVVVRLRPCVAVSVVGSLFSPRGFPIGEVVRFRRVSVESGPPICYNEERLGG